MHIHVETFSFSIRKCNCASSGVGLSQLYDQMFDGQNDMASNVKKIKQSVI